jgi:hypothetical protein
MIALRQHLIAAAHAHELAADLLGAIRLLRQSPGGKQQSRGSTQRDHQGESK